MKKYILLVVMALVVSLMPLGCIIQNSTNPTTTSESNGTPTLVLNPSSDTPGSKFTVDGFYFTPGATINDADILWDNSPLTGSYVNNVDNTGYFTMALTLSSNSSPGTHTIEVTDSSGKSATITLTVLGQTTLPPTTTPTIPLATVPPVTTSSANYPLANSSGTTVNLRIDISGANVAPIGNLSINQQLNFVATYSTALEDYLFTINNNNENSIGIIDMGKMGALGDISSSIPQTGWVSTVAAMVGHGYIYVDSNGDAYGIYVTQDILSSTTNGVIGVQIEYGLVNSGLSPTPTIVATSGVAGSRQITISWNNTGATNYFVCYWIQGAGGLAGTPNPVSMTTSPYIFTGAGYGNYTFCVIAVYPWSDSNPSSQVVVSSP